MDYLTFLLDELRLAENGNGVKQLLMPELLDLWLRCEALKAAASLGWAKELEDLFAMTRGIYKWLTGEWE